jgi:ribonucleoside-diphosphate reductase alpha chain
MSQLEAIGRLVSLALRSGVETSSIIEQLRGIRCPSPSWEKGGRIFSCSDAIARVLERRAHDTRSKRVAAENSKKEAFLTPPTASGAVTESQGGGAKAKTMAKTENIVGVCPDCGSALWHIEGCMVCKSCGYSKCG